MQADLENGGIFLPQQGQAFAGGGGGGGAHGCWGGGKPLAGILPPAEWSLASGGCTPVSRREGKSKSGELRSQIKGDVGSYFEFFFTRTLRNALPPPPPLGLFLNRDHLWLIVHIV